MLEGSVENRSYQDQGKCRRPWMDDMRHSDCVGRQCGEQNDRINGSVGDSGWTTRGTLAVLEGSVENRLYQGKCRRQWMDDMRHSGCVGRQCGEQIVSREV